MLSLVIPVYNNEASLPRLFLALEGLADQIAGDLEVVFVVDGARDASLAILQRQVSGWRVRSTLVELSRNFGSFAAIAAGLRHATGDFMAVMAADLQEPPGLILDFHRVLSSGEADVVFGVRTGRSDPWWSRVLSTVFWRLYRRMVVSDVPVGGVDVFACTRQVRDQLADLKEVNTNLVALLFWIGFRRAFVPYEREARREGRSGWTFSRKLRYALDSIFNFTDLPVRALLWLGAIGTTLSVLAGAWVFAGWWIGRIPVLGYTPLMLVVMFFGGLTALAMGIIGQYLWLSLENARRRPTAIVRTVEAHPGAGARTGPGADQRRTADRKTS